jgi:hypothetical protein
VSWARLEGRVLRQQAFALSLQGILPLRDVLELREQAVAFAAQAGFRQGLLLRRVRGPVELRAHAAQRGAAPQPPDQGAEGQRCQPEQDRDDLGAAQLGTGQPGNDVTRVHAAPGDVDGARARAPPGAV